MRRTRMGKTDKAGRYRRVARQGAEHLHRRVWIALAREGDAELDLAAPQHLYRIPAALRRDDLRCDSVFDAELHQRRLEADAAGRTARDAGTGDRFDREQQFLERFA